MQQKTIHPLFVIGIFLIGFLILNEVSKTILSFISIDGEVATDTYLLIGTAFRLLYTLVSYWLIKKYNLLSLAGLGQQKFKNWFLLLFPLYLLIISGPDPGEFNFAAIPFYKYGILLLYVFSVGFAEEFMLRGFIQSHLLKHFGQTKKRIVLSVVLGAALFGVLHLLKFDKGLYGEIAQVLYATFIGTMFGALLLRTNKLWPLIVLHALIDFINNFDYIDKDIFSLNTPRTDTSPENALVITLAVLPCFIYGLFLLRKVKVDAIQEKLK